MQEVRVRFAPSPTGPLHIGGARSALFNYLFCKHMGGQLVLRIEDTDLERSSLESEKEIMESLKWLGITWDEGPDCGGNYAPYRQTERVDIYRSYAERLLEEGKAYKCYCSEEELSAEREEAMQNNSMPIYSEKCLNLSPEEEQRYLAEGRKPVIRFHVPKNERYTINDLVRGEVSFESNGVGDFVIVKSDGIPTYNFAVVIDDYLMRISHVVRAEEHLSNTPRQIALYRGLGWEEPFFAHVSLILGEDRSKMSKRHGATSVIQYREQGFLPQAIINFLALLGWSPGIEEEIFGLDKLIELFSLEKVSKRPAVFDLEKLKWLNGHYIRNTSSGELAALALPYLQKKGIMLDAEEKEALAWLSLVMEAIKEKISSLGEITDFLELFTAEEISIEEEEAKKVKEEESFASVIEIFLKKIASKGQPEAEEIKALIKETGKEAGQKGKQLFMPLRVALTGKLHGPELHNIIPVLGREKTISRLEKALLK